MGRPKPTLRFGPETMLARVVRLLGEAVDVVAVAGGVGQRLPPLPPSVILVRDRQEGLGPLEGMAVGLEAIGPRAEAAFVTGCDVPLLRPALVRRMLELSAGYDVAVPHVAGYDEPLAGVYRTGLLPQIEALLCAGRLRPAFLFQQARTRRVTADELAEVDPRLESLANVNTPEDYGRALQRVGLSRLT